MLLAEPGSISASSHASTEKGRALLPTLAYATQTLVDISITQEYATERSRHKHYLHPHLSLSRNRCLQQRGICYGGVPESLFLGTIADLRTHRMLTVSRGHLLFRKPRMLMIFVFF